jgi:CheY-like chemotaxis protein
MPAEQIIEGHPTLRLLNAPNANLCIALARNQLPEVILINIKLPGTDGFQALKILHEDPATTHIPVIAFSVNAMPHEIKMGLQAGSAGISPNPSRLMTL